MIWSKKGWATQGALLARRVVAAFTKKGDPVSSFTGQHEILKQYAMDEKQVKFIGKSGYIDWVQNKRKYAAPLAKASIQVMVAYVEMVEKELSEGAGGEGEKGDCIGEGDYEMIQEAEL